MESAPEPEPEADGETFGVVLNTADALRKENADTIWSLTARAEEMISGIPDPEERVRAAFFLMNAISSRNWWRPVD